jgi:hypothetical protein
LIYCAGPFSAPTREGVEANIAAMELLGIEVAKLGALPVIPHANTQHPDFEHVQPYTFWIDGTLELMRRCDAVLCSPRWKESSGARGERDEAVSLGLPVFDSLAELADWLRGAT